MSGRTPVRVSWACWRPPAARHQTAGRTDAAMHVDTPTISHGTTVVALRHGAGRAAGRRPAGHVGPPHQPPLHREGVPRRPPRGGGHRRCRRAVDGDGAALPGCNWSTTRRWRASPSASTGRPTSSAGWCWQTCRQPCRAWWRYRCSRAGTPHRERGPAVPVRRDRRTLRGAGLRRPTGRAACMPAPS